MFVVYNLIYFCRVVWNRNYRSMATRNVLKTDSIDSLIYKGKRGDYRGYRRELLTEEAHDNIKNLIFCCKCVGVSRKPRLAEGKTFCTPCYKGTLPAVDSRVDEIVLQLKSRCPLSTRGCDWSGQLGDIVQHMSMCVKLRVACVTGCGEVLERCETDGHLKKCPLRRERCEYCGEEVQASGANRHIALCPRHPDGEVSCPYKELGCDVLGIKRKDLDTHLADYSISHQKLMLREIHQLRSENNKLRSETDKLRDVSERKECENSKKFQYLKRRNLIIHKRIWILLTLAVLGIAILMSYLRTERNRVDEKEHSIQSNKDSIQSNKQSIQLHDQSIQFLISNTMSNATYLYDYIQDIDETLRGVEWTHRNVGGETYYGPIFYLGTCRLRLHVSVYRLVSDGRYDANYYVTRLRGDHNDVSDTCHITYVHLYTVNTRDDSRDNVRNLSVSEKLKVGDEYWINGSFVILADSSQPTRTIRIYFDLK